jgi:hypothetical protein
MQNIQKLSDDQLINLFKSKSIDKDLKNNIIYEIDRRELSEIKVFETNLSNKKKVEIIFTSGFLFKKHLKYSNDLLISGNKKGYKQYWFYFTVGMFLNFILLLIVARFIIKPYFT